MIIWRRRGVNIKEHSETQDLCVDLEGRSEIIVEDRTTKEQKHDGISGKPLSVWQGKPCG